MAKLEGNLTIEIKLKNVLSLWQALKIRIAGFKYCEINSVGGITNLKLKK